MDGKLNVHKHKSYLIIKDALASVEAEQERLEPIKSPFNKEEKAALCAASPSWPAELGISHRRCAPP